MDSFNDIVNERFNSKPLNDIEDSLVSRPRSEQRAHLENEALAEELRTKLSSVNKLPFLAVAYSGIPRDTINRHVTTALERSRTPIKLFMHLIKQEALWRDYQELKEKRKSHDEAQ